MICTCKASVKPLNDSCFSNLGDSFAHFFLASALRSSQRYGNQRLTSQGRQARERQHFFISPEIQTYKPFLPSPDFLKSMLTTKCWKRL
jgi:hypothetical protein